MSEAPVRFALVGCGAVTTNHYLPALAGCRGAEAALVVDADLGRARAAARRWGISGTAADYREVPGRAEAAVVALPNHLHAPVAIDLLRAGVHVLVEKPMALATADCDAMIAAAEHSGAVLTAGLQFRLFDSTRLVAELLGSGLLGPLERFELRLGVVSRWPFATDFLLRRETAGGGVLVDYGVHVLDLLLHWLGDWGELRYRDDARGGLESDCELELEMRSGLAGSVEISRSRDLANTCLLVGGRGRLEVGIWDPDPPIVLSAGEPARGAGDGAGPAPAIQESASWSPELRGRARRLDRPGSPRRGLDFNGAFRRQLEDLAAAVREGREPAVPAREARRSVALIEACYAARRPLALPWDDPLPAGAPAAG